MANRKGVKVKRRRDVQIKKVKKYISKHIYSFVAYIILHQPKEWKIFSCSLKQKHLSFSK